MTDVPDLARGLSLLRARRWHEAHEALEAAWAVEPAGPRREALRGLVHGAVALEHLRRGNRAGACLQAAKCVARVEAAGAALGPALAPAAVTWSRAVRALLLREDALPPGPEWPVP